MNQSSGQGALFELVARGQKDAYFTKDDGAFVFDSRYEATTPHLAERRTTIPLNDTRFGQSFEVEIDTFGDILTECALEVDLPTWLPPLPIGTETGPFGDPAIVNQTATITTNDAAAQTYGYVNGCGYFLFETIQFYQDQVLLQEWSGDVLYAKQLTEGSLNSAELALIMGGAQVAQQAGLKSSVAQHATPPRLRISLPLPGMQCPGDAGLPLCAMAYQKFRIRGVLRKLEDLVVCSDSTALKPSPWSVPSFRVQYADGSDYPFVPLRRTEIGQPRVVLSTVQHYVSEEAQKALRSQEIQIPFRRLFENRFTFGELDYIALDKGGVASVTRALDGRHPTERLFWFFRNWDVFDSNRLDDFANHYFDAGHAHAPTAMQPYTVPYGGFYYRLKLNIAGREREEMMGGLVWERLSGLANDERATTGGVGSMNWSTGAKMGTIYPAPRQPEGTVNFTTADRPTLLIELANITSTATIGQRKADMRACTEGWCVYQVKDGRGRMMFAA
jgi:hypothetical protein